MSTEAKKNRIIRIPSFEIEGAERKRKALLANKHKVLTELGVYESRSQEDLAQLQAQKSKTLSEKSGTLGAITGLLAGSVPAACIAAIVTSRMSEATVTAPDAAVAGLASLLLTEAAFAYAGYHIGREISKRQVLRLSAS